MNTVHRIRQAAGAIAGLSALIATAQAPSTPSEVTRISPFEVTSQQDTSFQASSVGTGSRLAVNLADVSAAYSVINRAFIDALGITDSAEAASWATGQTFSYNDASGDAARHGRQGSFMSRGVQNEPGSFDALGGNTGNQVNFYQSGNSTSDSYAVESFDFGRGPNSALFGNSNQTGGNSGFSGVASTQTKRARLDASRTQISAEIGYWGYRRATLDHNLPLTPTFSLRTNLVDGDQARYQHMSYSRIRGITLAGTWKPTATTNVTFNAINQSTRVKTPGNDIRENMSGWDGRTTFRGPVLNSFISTTATPGSIAPVAHPVYGQIMIVSGPERGTGAAFTGLTFNGEPQGIQRRNAGNHFMLDTMTMTIMDWEQFALTRQADGTSRVPIYTKTAPNGGYFVRGTNAAFYNAGNSNGAGPQNPYTPIREGRSGLPVDMYDHALIGTTRPMLGARDTMASWTPNTIQAFRDFQFGVDQNLGENLYLSLGGDINRTRALTRNDDAMNSNPGLNVDINQLRPDGSPNPHFLQIYSFSQSTNRKGGLQYANNFTNDQAIRLNAVYNLNLGRWGRYTFNVNGNASTRQFESLTRTTVMNIPTIDIRRQTAEAQLYNSTYHYDRIRSDISSMVDRSYPFTEVTYNAAGIPTVTNSIVRPMLVLRGAEGGQGGNEVKSDSLTQSLTLQTQANLLDNKVVMTLTGKRQFDKNLRISAVAQGDLPGPISFTNTTFGLAASTPYGTTLWDGQTPMYKPMWGGTIEDYYALTYKPIDPATGRPRVFTTGPNAGRELTRLATARPRQNDAIGLSVRNPLYQAGSPNGEQIFQDDFSPPVARKYSGTYSAGFVFRPVRGVSPFVNFSSQGVPPAIAELDMNYAVRRVTIAKEFAFGSNIDIGNKVHFKWNYYRNTRINNPASNNVISSVNELINSRNRFDTLPDSNTNLLGYIPLPGNPDYTTTENNGYEVELALTNVVRGLRLTANGTKGSGGEDQSTRYPLTKAWMFEADSQEMMKALLEDAGGILDTSRRPDYDNGTEVVSYAPGLAIANPAVVPSGTLALDQTRAVNAYNNAWIAYDEIIDQLAVTRTRRVPSANIFADYTVQSGPAKGLGIGFGVQWQGKRSEYNKGTWTIIDPADPTRAIDNPLYTNQDVVWIRGDRNYQANLNYTYTLRNGNSLRFGLRINNPFDDQTQRYNYTLQQPQGDLTKPNREHLPIAGRRKLDPRNFRLTTTYSFAGAQRR